MGLIIYSMDAPTHTLSFLSLLLFSSLCSCVNDSGNGRESSPPFLWFVDSFVIIPFSMRVCSYYLTLHLLGAIFIFIIFF